jgi:uncharacterized membrane protein
MGPARPIVLMDTIQVLFHACQPPSRRVADAHGAKAGQPVGRHVARSTTASHVVEPRRHLGLERENGSRQSSAEHPSEIAGVVHRNIRALIEVRRQFEKNKSFQDRVADTITAFAGSIYFVYLHVLIFGGWLAINLGAIPWVKPFDPFPFVMLAMIASVEAIFLSTFVLITQNRMAQVAEKRAELDLQISLLSEHEVTRLLSMVEAIGHQMGVHFRDEGLEELKKDVAPEKVLDEIEHASKSPHQ